MTTPLLPPRLRFDRAEAHAESDGHSRVDVHFTFGDRSIRTSATAASQTIEILKAAAEATLQALHEAADSKFACSLADLDHVSALGKNLIAVLINVEFEGRQVQVFGSCQISESEMDAAVKASLNATNRFFELALRG